MTAFVISVIVCFLYASWILFREFRRPPRINHEQCLRDSKRVIDDVVTKSARRPIAR